MLEVPKMMILDTNSLTASHPDDLQVADHPLHTDALRLPPRNHTSNHMLIFNKSKPSKFFQHFAIGSLKKKEKKRKGRKQKSMSLQTKCAISFSQFKTPPLNTHPHPPKTNINPYSFLLSFFLFDVCRFISISFGNATPSSPPPLGPQEYLGPESFHLPRRNTPLAHLPPPHQL